MLGLIFASTLVAAACAPSAMISAPPAVLSGSLASQFPNGVSVDGVSLTPDGSGAVFAVRSGARGALRPIVESWGKGVKFAERSPKCGASPIDLDRVDFFPASSGVAGIPRIVAGVDFDDVGYSGPADCTRRQVANLFAGAVSGVSVAVVMLRCDYADGFDTEAQVFRIVGANATKIGTLGESGMTSNGSVFPPPPGGWIYISFRDGVLYADVWDRTRACSDNGDWTSTAYAVRSEKLVALSTLRHHRKGLRHVACASG